MSAHILYTNKVTDCLKHAGISLTFIHQLLKLKRFKSMCLLNCAHVKDYLHNSKN